MNSGFAGLALVAEERQRNEGNELSHALIGVSYWILIKFHSAEQRRAAAATAQIPTR